MEHNFTEIPVALPPVLMRLFRYPGNARFVALFYVGGKATWADGLVSATFSYYNAFQPLKDHPTVDIHLHDKDLGTDDTPPTHALLCDRQERKVFVGEIDEVLDLLSAQASELRDKEATVKYKELFDEPTNVSEMHVRGMFEFIGRPTPDAQAETEQLLRWLDGYITEDLIKRYLKMLEEHDLSALLPLQYIRQRAEAIKRRVGE
ncbi:MAG TPA: hypothetical protein VKB86_06020 [Pyrinomonadaceae bacterium]|nr:hypothetical protein [Pyrinomonadaceae bacterium]